MTEWRLFDEGTIPEYATPEWYASRERAPHLEQPGHQGRLALAARYVERAIIRGATSVVDLGAGDGGLLSTLPDIARWGYDLQPSNIEGAAERGEDVQLVDVLRDSVKWADIAIATEVLEHLVEPHALVRTIGEHCSFIVASSPAFETPESHYGFHLWSWDREGYAALIRSGGFEILRHEIVGDFQVVLGARP